MMSCIPMSPERRKSVDRYLLCKLRAAQIGVVLAEDKLREAQQALRVGKDPLEDLILQHQSPTTGSA